MAVRVYLVVALLQLVGCEKQPPADTTRTVNAHSKLLGDARPRLSPDLLNVLADPGDKGPLTYTIDTDGNEWLVNQRNGYRYPVENGVPVLLLDEGAKHRDTSLISP